MKDFSQIGEGLLAGQDKTLQAGNDYTKKVKQAEEIKKNLLWLTLLWDRGYSNGDEKSDFFGKEIKIGDVVLFNVGDTAIDDWSFGVVIETPNRYGDNCKIIVGESRVKGKDENDPYNDCISYYAPSKNIFVLARHKKAKQILQIIESVA